MFRILYRIPEDSVEEFQGVSSSVFETENIDINGQLQISFGEHDFGYVADEVPFGNERLLLWFNLLIDVLTALDKKQYALLNQLGSHDFWFEFVEKGEMIEISKIKLSPSENPTAFILQIQPLQIEQVCWSGISVNKNEFVREIIAQSRSLINDICTINPEMSRTKKVKYLKEKLSVIDHE